MKGWIWYYWFSFKEYVISFFIDFFYLWVIYSPLNQKINYLMPLNRHTKILTSKNIIIIINQELYLKIIYKYLYDNIWKIVEPYCFKFQKDKLSWYLWFHRLSVIFIPSIKIIFIDINICLKNPVANNNLKRKTEVIFFIVTMLYCSLLFLAYQQTGFWCSYTYMLNAEFKNKNYINLYIVLV